MDRRVRATDPVCDERVAAGELSSTQVAAVLAAGVARRRRTVVVRRRDLRPFNHDIDLARRQRLVFAVLDLRTTSRRRLLNVQVRTKQLRRSRRRMIDVILLIQPMMTVSFAGYQTTTVTRNQLIGSRPSDHYFRSVCLSVCLFVCAEFFSAVFDPVWINRTHVTRPGLVVSPRI